MLQVDDLENILKPKSNGFYPNATKWHISRSRNVQIKCQFLPSIMEGDPKKLIKNCTDLVPVQESMEEGKKCFTYFR